MTQAWPNSTIELSSNVSQAAERSPDDMAVACHKAAMTTIGGALIQIGFASSSFGSGIALLSSAAAGIGQTFSVVSFVCMVAGLWLTIANWDNPHANEAHMEFFRAKRPLSLRLLVGVFGATAVATLFVCLLGSNWLLAEFGIPVGVSKLLVGISFLSITPLTAFQAAYLFSMSDRYRAQIK